MTKLDSENENILTMEIDALIGGFKVAVLFVYAPLEVIKKEEIK